MSYGVNAPQGLQLVSRDGSPYSGAALTLPIPSGYAANLFVGTPLMMSAQGYPILYVAGAGNPILGVAIGFNYILPNDLNPAPKSYWPANTVTKGAAPGSVAIVTDPEALWSIQLAAAQIDQSMVFNNLDIVNAGSGDTNTGLSQASGGAPANGNANYPLKVWGLDTSSTLNAATPLYQNILVKFNNCASRAGTAGV